MDNLDFLPDAPAVEDVQPAQETVEAPPQEAKAEQPRDPSGKFAPKQPETVEPPAAAQPEPQPEPAQQPVKEDPIMVPLAALHETRDKVKALEAALAQFQQPQRQPQPVEVPDPELDPVGFAQFQDNQRYTDHLFFSERLAVIQHGQETFEKAKQWGLARCDADPYFNAQVRSSQDPYSIVMAEYQRDQIATQVTPSDFEQFQAWKAAQGQLAQTQQQPAAQPAVPETTALPRSIATAPSAGGVQTIAVGPGVAFDEVIK